MTEVVKIVFSSIFFFFFFFVSKIAQAAQHFGSAEWN